MNKSVYTLSISTGPLKGVSFDISTGVTYLVGKNGAGKTQVLEALKSGTCSIMLKGQKGNLNNYATLVWGEQTYDDKKGRSRDFADLKPIFDELGQISIEESKEMKRTKEERDERGNKLNTFRETITQTLNGEEFEPGMMSSGTKAIVQRFAWNARNAKAYPENRDNGPNGPSGYFILWDEPEQFLHPSEQKKVPARFDKWLQSTLPTLVRHTGANPPPTFIFAATHSPFILSGVGDRKNHNVVCMDQCAVVGSGEPKSLSEVRMEANELLGAGIQDMLPGKMILTEGSVEALIRGIANKFDFELEEFIVTANGDDNLKQRINSVSELVKLIVQIGKSWPERDVFKLEIHAVVDDQNIKGEIDCFETTQWISIDTFALGNIQLEDIYPLDWVNEFLENEKQIDHQWDGHEAINKFLELTCSIKGQEKGQFKVELANYIVSKVESVQTLEEDLPILNEFFRHWEKANE